MTFTILPKWSLFIYLMFSVTFFLAGMITKVHAQGDTFEFRYGRAQSFGGNVKVREFDLEGDRLDLKNDLGMTQWETIDLVWSLGPPLERRWRWELSFNKFTGSTVFPRDITFNGTVYQAGGTAVIDDTEYYRASAFYEYPFGDRKKFGIYFLIGFVANFLDFHIDAPLSPTSQSTEKRENFARQWVIVPVFGVGGIIRLGKNSHFFWEGYTSTIKSMNSHRFEGGVVEVDEKNDSIVIGFRRDQGVFFPSIAYRHRTYEVNQQSGEDGNEFKIEGGILEIGLIQLGF